MNITATNKATGEVIDLPASTPAEIVMAWQVAKEYEKAANSLKIQLKELVPDFVGDRGVSAPISGHVFRISYIQPMTYDKAVMRNVLDADTFDVLLKPDKTAVDKYIKENLETLGDDSTKLRKTMIPAGNPYQTIKLEKL